MLTLLSLGLSQRMINCVPLCQFREHRYIVELSSKFLIVT